MFPDNFRLCIFTIQLRDEVFFAGALHTAARSCATPELSSLAQIIIRLLFFMYYSQNCAN